MTEQTTPRRGYVTDGDRFYRKYGEGVTRDKNEAYLFEEGEPFLSYPGFKWVPLEAAAPLRGYTSAERKEVPIHTFMTGYFPDALWSLARMSKKSNDKHNPGEPMHWARGKSTDQLECATRHLFTPGEIDAETGEIELAAVAWRALAELQLREEKRLVAAGIRPLSGVIPE